MKTFYLFTFLLFISFAGFAQSELQEELDEEETTGFDKNKMYYGGYLNLSFGSYTVIGIQPLAAYKFTPQLSGGVKLTYEYSSSGDYSASNYGGSLFGRYRVIPQAYLHVEFSSMNYELPYSFEETQRKWVPFLFVGGGYSQPISKNTWLTAQVLFDVIQDESSPYSAWEPFFSIGVGVGF